MQVPNTTENIEFILNLFNCNEIMVNVCRTNPDLIASVIEEYITNSSSVVKCPYMVTFEEVKKYVSSKQSGGNSNKIPMIKQLRNDYGIDLATATGTIDMWINLYIQDSKFLPKSFYDLSGKSIPIPTSVI